MANKRMFSVKITNTDRFLEMSPTAQCLYFHMSMEADDDGFVDNPKTVLRKVGCNEDDFRILLFKGYIIPFESGVVVIRDWHVNNYIRSDRYQKTHYLKELAQLGLNDDKSYILLGIPNDNQNATNDTLSIDKISIDKNSIDNKPEKAKKISEKELEEMTGILLAIIKSKYSMASDRFNKKVCKQKLAVLLKKYEFEVIRVGYENYINYKSELNTEITYILNISTFLNQETFNEYQEKIEVEKSKVKGNVNVIGSDDYWKKKIEALPKEEHKEIQPFEDSEYITNLKKKFGTKE